MSSGNCNSSRKNLKSRGKQVTILPKYPFRYIFALLDLLLEGMTLDNRMPGIRLRNIMEHVLLLEHSSLTTGTRSPLSNESSRKEPLGTLFQGLKRLSLGSSNRPMCSNMRVREAGLPSVISCRRKPYETTDYQAWIAVKSYS
jgi:hypothetical protein